MYSKADRRKILDELYPQLEQGKGLNTICNEQKEIDKNYPTRNTITNWVNDLGKEEIDRYARSRDAGVHALVESMTDIAKKCLPDSGSVGKARLEIDVIKWTSSKLFAAVYGDKQVLDHQSKGEKIALNIIGTDQKTIDNAG